METILIIRLSAMGDAAIAAPVLQSLAKNYPDKKILLLTRKAFFPIFEFTNPTVELIVVDDFLDNGIFGIYQLYIKLRQYKIDKIADFHNVLRTNILRQFFYFTKTTWVSIDKNRAAKKELTAKVKTHLNQLTTSSVAYAKVLAQLNVPIQLDHHLVSNQATKINAVGFAPGSKHDQKNWQAENNQQLIDYIIENTSADIYLFGDQNTEKELLETLASVSARVKLTFHVSLAEQLELIQSLQAMISMDSANMHLASAVGTPVISIWCATSPLAGFMGYGQKIEHAIQLDLNCRPCSVYGNKKCWRGDLACTKIPIEIITQKLQEFID